MEEKRKYIRLYKYDYSKNGAYFITICTHKRQRLFGDEAIIPNVWYAETGDMQYREKKEETSDSSVGAHPCVRPLGIQMVERWLHKIQENFDTVFLDYYVIMPDHIHLILFLIDERDAHMGAPLQIENEDDPDNSRSVSNIIKWFKTMTTNEYINLVKRGFLPSFNKHIWQRGYFDHVIRNRDDLYECRKYIKNNPLKEYYTRT